MKGVVSLRRRMIGSVPEEWNAVQNGLSYVEPVHTNSR